MDAIQSIPTITDTVPCKNGQRERLQVYDEERSVNESERAKKMSSYLEMRSVDKGGTVLRIPAKH